MLQWRENQQVTAVVSTIWLHPYFDLASGRVISLSYKPYKREDL